MFRVSLQPCFMSGGSFKRSGGGAAARDGDPSDHSDESFASNANKELLARTPSSSITPQEEDADAEGPEVAGHGATPEAPHRKTRTCKTKISAIDARIISQAKPTGHRSHRAGVSVALATRYGITPKAVRDIWKGRTWAKATGQSSTGPGDAPQNTGTGGEHVGAGIVGARASPGLGHNAAAHGGEESTFTPAPLSRAQYAAAAPAMLHQNWGPHIHDLPAPTANDLADRSTWVAVRMSISTRGPELMSGSRAG